MRALTLTLHPAIDRVIAVERLVPGATFDGKLALIVPSGKGVNTARTLRCVLPAEKVSAAVWLGAAERAWFSRELSRISGVRTLACERPCATRIAQTFLEADRRETHIKEAMEAPTPKEQRELLGWWKKAARHADVLAVCGSAPPGTSSATLRGIFHGASQAAVAIADTNGPALKIAAESGLHGIKGNAAEIGELLGVQRPLDPRQADDQKLLAELLQRKRAPASILMTLGAAGAALITLEKVLFAAAPTLPSERYRSATGCGDAATAGWIWGLGEHAPEDVCLARAVACGSAKAASADPGSLDPRLMRTLLKRIAVQTLHLTSRH